MRKKSRALARRWLEAAESAGIDCARWRRLVEATDIHWDRIVGVEPAGEREVFAVTSGNGHPSVLGNGLVLPAGALA